MNGLRHIDRIGQCAGLPIVSAPSPVMEVTEKPTAFYIHTLAIDAESLGLMTPDRVIIEGEAETVEFGSSSGTRS